MSRSSGRVKKFREKLSRSIQIDSEERNTRPGNRKVETENRADRTKATEGLEDSKIFFAIMNKYCYLTSSNAIPMAI
jgi:hypothetical protein